MAKKVAANALDRVRFLAAAGCFTDVNDGELLNRCVTGLDEAAFTVLVERHGEMVYSVCSRILRNPHDAEDACQATFLVLARKASSIRKQPSVASWLHGVARRASLTVLRERAARQRHERKASTGEPQSTSATDPPWSEVLVLLDEELERLPDRIRGPIVLCYLEGKTRDEAAAALGITQGRLHGLLQRGRALLHDRLAKRGVTFGSGFLTVGLSGGAGLALPPTIAIRIVHGAIATSGGLTLAPALAGAQTTSIANEVLRAMFYAKLKTAFVWSAGCAVVAFALVGGGVFPPGLARDEDKPARPVAAVPAPKSDPKATPVQVRKVLSMATDKPNDYRHATIAVSNEQKSVWSRNFIVKDISDPKSTTSGLHLTTLDGEKPKRTHLGDSTTFGFIPKSTMGYAVMNWDEGVVLWDTRTHTKIGDPFPHELREDTMPIPVVSPDGEVMVTRSKLDHLQFWELKTRKPIAPEIAQRGIVWKMEFSVDGKWLFSNSSPGELIVCDSKAGKRVAGPFRHDSVFDATSYFPKTQQLVTIEKGREKDADWQSEAVIRSGKDWDVVQRVKLAGLIREVIWIDDTHLLVLSDEKTEPDEQGRLTSAGRNLLQVVALNGGKSEVETIVRGAAWNNWIGVAPDGKHFIANTYTGGTSCWKLGEPKPIWAKPSAKRVQFGDGDWALLTNKEEAIVYSLVDGKELWRQEKIEDARVQGSDIWVFGQKSVEVWRVGVKTQ
jgi:RNA polymerase sigma factor (sigma-70 family)